MIDLMAPVVDPDDGFTLYPVRHALGSIGFSFTRESQERWQALADKQSEWLEDRARNQIKKRT
jgi:hypothetical protein